MLKFLQKSLRNSEIKIFKSTALFIAAFIAWKVISPPENLSADAFHMIIIFATSMTGIMLGICRPVALLFIALLLANLTGTMDVKQNFSGFSSTIPWFLFFVISLSSVITKTTLGMRLAYIFIKCFGHKITGLSYSIIFTEFFTAPILPSNTARAASIGFPLVTSISKCLAQYTSNATLNSTKTYLALLYSYSNAVCSAVFATGMISNALILEAMEEVNLKVSWISWLNATIIPCGIILLVIPFVLRVICNPKIECIGNIKEQIMKNYEELGALTEKEKFIILMFIIMLFMWIFSNAIGIPAISTALLGICVFIIVGILDIREMLSNYESFNIFIVFGMLMSLINCLMSSGAINWFTDIVSVITANSSPQISFLWLSIIYFFSHYFFTGEGARIIALYSPFLAISLALGIDRTVVAITLAVFSSISDVLTHYTGPVAITMFSTGYATTKKWLTCGFITAIVMLAIWFVYYGKILLGITI
jgi:DASS family divalent anion:Na+ symporter